MENTIFDVLQILRHICCTGKILDNKEYACSTNSITNVIEFSLWSTWKTTKHFSFIYSELEVLFRTFWKKFVQ